METRYVAISKAELARNYELLRSIYSLLVSAHYRNEPDDLVTLLDAPHHEVRALVAGGVPVAVAQVAVEGPVKDVARAVSTGVEGVLVLDKLLRFDAAMARFRGWRIVRIAVHPQLQRRGLGSRLLSELERECRLDFVGSIFSRGDVLRFWVRNGYRVIYVSPRFNRVTGEKNIAVVKPISPTFADALNRVLPEIKLRLLLGLHDVYRDLPSEYAADALLSLRDVRCPFQPELTPGQARRLELFLSGRVRYEAASDAIYLLAIRRICSGWLPSDHRALLALVARVLQGKPMDDVASLVKASIEGAQRIVEHVAKSVATRRT